MLICGISLDFFNFFCDGGTVHLAIIDESLEDVYNLI